MSKHKALHRKMHTVRKAISKAASHIRAIEGPTDEFNKAMALRYIELAKLWHRSMAERQAIYGIEVKLAIATQN